MEIPDKATKEENEEFEDKFKEHPTPEDMGAVGFEEWN